VEQDRSFLVNNIHNNHGGCGMAGAMSEEFDPYIDGCDICKSGENVVHQVCSRCIDKVRELEERIDNVANMLGDNVHVLNNEHEFDSNFDYVVNQNAFDEAMVLLCKKEAGE
jgi:hypothetical protein